MRNYSIIILFLLFSSLAEAQLTDSLSGVKNNDYYDYLNCKYQFCTIENSSVLDVYEVKDFSEFSIRYSAENGSFKNVYQALNAQTYTLSAKGMKKLNKVKLFGFFDYDKLLEQNKNWNYTINDDFDYPLILSDSLGGDWKKDRYKLGFKGSLDEVLGFLNLGLGIDYSVFMGGKDSDPRPENLANFYAVKPGFNFDLSKKHSLGVYGVFENYQEDIEVINEYGVGGRVLYKIIGLRQFFQPELHSTYEYTYSGKTFGGGISHVFQSASIVLTNYFSYKSSLSKAISDPLAALVLPETNELVSNAETDAENLIDKLAFSSNLWLETGTIRQQFKAYGSLKYLKTYVPRSEQVDFVNDHFNLGFLYSYEKSSGHSNSFKFNFQLDFFSDEYKNSLYGKADHQFMLLQASVQKPISLNAKNELLPIIGVSQKINTNAALIINPESPFIEEETIVTTHVVYPWFDYLSSNYTYIDLKLNYINKSVATYFFRAGVQYSRMFGIESKYRDSFCFSIGLIF